jgi:hypothetical protein
VPFLRRSTLFGATGSFLTQPRVSHSCAKAKTVISGVTMAAEYTHAGLVCGGSPRALNPVNLCFFQDTLRDFYITGKAGGHRGYVVLPDCRGGRTITRERDDLHCHTPFSNTHARRRIMNGGMQIHSATHALLSANCHELCLLRDGQRETESRSWPDKRQPGVQVRGELLTCACE